MVMKWNWQEVTRALKNGRIFIILFTVRNTQVILDLQSKIYLIYTNI